MTLLGYALDPHHPERTDSEVVRSLVESLGSWRDCLERTRSLGGRWALVVRDGRQDVLFHDAAGQRQVHHGRDAASGAVVAATSAGLVARTLGAPRDPAAMEFMAARAGGDGSVFWMPGDRSVHEGVRALLPNHVLDLRTGESHRFWPAPGEVATCDADPASEATRLLRAMLDAARRRFPLAVSMTAGWDSRLMLALSRPISSEVYCFTLLGPDTPRSSRDVVVPSRLLRRLGLEHHVLPYPTRIDEGLRERFREGVDAVKEAYSADIQAIRDAYTASRVCVTGDVAEVVKCYVQHDGPAPPGAADLARLTAIGQFPFALAAFEDWLRGVPASGIDLLDLFAWEQTAGRWQALIRAEYDIVQECLAPLNCRDLLVAMLSTDRSLRRPPEHAFLRDLIGRLWSDVLSEPINPPERPTARARAGRLLRTLGLYDWVPARLKRGRG
ncbi:MAG TPA: hypothetical protein PLL32_01360 [Anaeromyxobacteraceae bacterium]|nr:hypothetical protein [Anaeromyxobacteraceae bacterium]